MLSQFVERYPNLVNCALNISFRVISVNSLSTIKANVFPVLEIVATAYGCARINVPVAREQFGNPEKRESPLLEAATRATVKTRLRRHSA
jgi:hypothetical protein